MAKRRLKDERRAHLQKLWRDPSPQSLGAGSPTSWQLRGWGLGWGGCGVNSAILAPLLEVKIQSSLDICATASRSGCRYQNPLIHKSLV